MAFEEGIATSQEDFADKLRAFALANSWTIDNFDIVTDRLSISSGNIFAHLEWDNTNDIAVHQALGWIDASTAQGSHTNDSGNGGLTSSDRAINDVGNGPFTKHTFFAGSSPSTHLYAVLEYAPGQFRHFGAGIIEKFGDWTGGEFVCCSTWVAASANAQTSSLHCVMMDGGCDNQTRSSTMHVEGLPDQPASGKWGIFAQSTGPGNDGDGNGRVNLVGGMRGGPYTRSMGAMPSSLTQGFIPLIRVPCFYRHTATTPDQSRFLGYYPNIRTINMSAFQPGDNFTQGSDTWVVFPMIRRQTVGGSEEQTGFGGIAYKKT